MYQVAYQKGGKLGSWQLALPVETLEEAMSQVASLEGAGYPAYAESVHFWRTIGLPEGESPGWDYNACKRVF